MLPEGMVLRVDNGILYWENHPRETLTVQEAKEVAKCVRELANDHTVKAIVVDSREVNGNWPPDVDRVWIDLMADLPHHVAKTATLCKNPVTKLQLNYLSSQAGTENQVKAFTEEERDSMLNFLSVEELRFLDREAVE